MTRKLIPAIFILFILSSQNFISNAQVVFKDFNSAAVQAMVKGKTYAILSSDSTFNKWWQQALNEVWSVSTLTYITPAQLDTAVKSDKNVFLFAQARDKTGGAVRLINADDMTAKKDFTVMLEQGGVKQSKLLFTTAQSGPKIIGFFRYSPERAEVTAGMLEGEMLLAFMNQSLQIIVDNKIKGSVRDSVWDHIYYEAPQIKDKTMLFNKVYSNGDIALEKKVLLNNKVIDDYPFEYEQDSANAVKEILKNSGNYVYLFLYYPSSYVNQADDSGDILVYDPSQKKMLYYDDNLGGPWLEKGEFKDMIYAIKQK